MKGTLFLVSCVILSYIDASQLYHSIRGQAVIKLYVIFNLLDVLNRLGSAFGHDILDSLFSKATVTGVEESSLAIRRLNRSTHFLIAIFYIFAHSMILFYQMIALNVAVNSYSNSLLPIMLSSNFVEIKSSVFKKCDDRNLFNITCADILERFQLCAYLFLILIRNFLEMTGGAGVDEILSHLYGLSVTILTPSKPLVFTNASFIPMYFGELAQDVFIIWARIQAAPEFKLFITLLFPAIYVIGSELIADLLKHAFITKFNEIPASIYTDFKLSLFRDLAGKRLDRGNRPKWESQWEDPNDADPDMAIVRGVDNLF